MTNVGIKLSLDSAEAVASANEMARAFKGMSSAMASAAEGGDPQKAREYAQAMKSIKNLQDPNSGPVGRGGPQGRMQNGALSVVNSMPGYVNTLGRGDLAGASISASRDISGGVRGAGRDVLSDDKNSGLGKALMGVGIGGAVIAGLAAGANAIAEQWEKVREASMGLTASLENVAGGAEENGKKILQAFASAAEAANKWGYSAEEGMASVKGLSKYGLTRESGVYSASENVFHFARTTDVDRSLLEQVKGGASRYGKGANALEYTFGGLQSAGMGKGQYAEYLQILSKMFEDSLSRGVVKGYDKLSGNMALMNKIGGGNNPLWQGEQGYSRFQSMNNGVVNATSLSSLTDVMTYKAAKSLLGKGASITDTMMMMEGGITPELMKKQVGQIFSNLGHDQTTVNGALKNMYGLNWTGAETVRQFMEKGDYAGATALIKDPGKFESDDLRALRLQEKVSTDVAVIGSTFAGYKTDLMSKLESMTSTLVYAIKGDIRSDLRPGEILSGLYSGSETKISNKARSIFDEGLKMDSKEQRYQQTVEIMKELQGLTPEEFARFNRDNMVNPNGNLDDYRVWHEAYKQALKKIKTMDPSKLQNQSEGGIYNGSASTSILSDKNTSWGAKGYITRGRIGEGTEEEKAFNKYVSSQLEDKLKTPQSQIDFFKSDEANKFFDTLNFKRSDGVLDKNDTEVLIKMLKELLDSYQVKDSNGKVIGMGPALQANTDAINALIPKMDTLTIVRDDGYSA